MTLSSLGFEIGSSASGGDFLPRIQYNAATGTFARIDRVQGVEGWENVNIPIGPKEFRAQFDLENLEVGQIDFATGGAPHFVLVRLADLVQTGYPPPPTDRHKKGMRVVLKLASEIAGEGGRIREFSTNSVTALRGIDAINKIYLEGRAANPGKLPVFGLDSLRPTIGIKTGSGARSSTNYQPNFILLQWAARGDLAPNLRSSPPVQPAAPAAQNPNNFAPVNTVAQNGHGQRPATGSRPAAPPQHPVASQDSDFG
jgi:hypothetical protein